MAIVYIYVLWSIMQQTNRTQNLNKLHLNVEQYIWHPCVWQLNTISVFIRTCPFKLTGPHTLSWSCALRAVRCLTAGFRAVAGEKNLPLVYSAVMFWRATYRAANTCSLRTVCAPLTLKSVLGIQKIESDNVRKKF